MRDIGFLLVFLASFALQATLIKIAEVVLPKIMPYGGISGAMFITVWLPATIYVSYRFAERVTRKR